MPQLRWLVTGCSSGIGELLIRSILARGDKAIATTRGDVSRIAALKDAGAETYSLDATAPLSAFQDVVAQALENGPIDVLVNNAGYMQVGMAEEISIETYQEQFDVNFFGVIKATQAVLPHFRARKSGSIVSIGSIAGISGRAGVAAYCGSKFALEGWHDALREEVAHLGIKMLICEWGFFRTSVFTPQNMRLRSGGIADYDPMREGIAEFLADSNGKQPGDPAKGCEVLVDVVRGEGRAEGKEWPARLPFGPDAVELVKGRGEEYLAVCEGWGEVAASTNFE